jgi:hypothetical protein
MKQPRLENEMLRKDWTATIDGARIKFSPDGNKLNYCGLACQTFSVTKQNEGEEHMWQCPTMFVSTRATRSDVEYQFAGGHQRSSENSWD